MEYKEIFQLGWESDGHYVFEIALCVLCNSK